MGKELCFCINNMNLYLEKVLVDYMDIPVFFLCKSKNDYFVVLCEDIENLTYVVVQNEEVDIYNLLNGKTSMRNAIVKRKKYWEIISGESVESDCVTEHLMSEIREDILPEKDACFEILTEDIKVYVQGFNERFFGTDYFKECPNNILINEIQITEYIDVNIDEYRDCDNLRINNLRFQKDERTLPLFYYDEEMDNIAVEKRNYKCVIWNIDKLLNEAA